MKLPNNPFKKPQHIQDIQTQIDRLAKLIAYETDHITRAEHIKEYKELTTLLADTKAKTAIKPDTIATIIANLAGILLILNHERLHCITSKALNQITKLRL